MSPDAPDDDRLASLFGRALELPRGRRREFLEEACGDDSSLRAELDSLLASHDSSPDFLDVLGARALLPALEEFDAGPCPVGETVAHYRILRRIGRGGMGEVFLARDLDLSRDVALKFLPTHLAADGPAGDRLRREARVASALDHPNIAVVHEVGTVPAVERGAGTRTFIAMAYCGDRTLADEIERAGSVPVGRAIGWATELADALSSAHEAGISHLDVKPPNLIVTDRGTLKLVDFGLATRSSDEDAARPSGGTVAYMSPEQIAGGPADRRADVWAAGVVLYEMLTGTRPFRGESGGQVARAILQDEIPPLRAVAPDVPERLARVVHRCLERNPGARYASATTLLTDLRTVSAIYHEGGGDASLVVLPFEEVGSGLVAAGFTDEIILDLSRVRSLRVIARASSRRLQGTGCDPAAIAGELGVQHALSGSISVEATRVRVTSSLIDARNGARTRMFTFEGDRDQLHGMRKELVRAVVISLGLTEPSGGTRNAGGLATDARAYEAFLRARHEAWSFSAGGLERARRSIESALAIVGHNELLYGTLGHITAMYADSGLERAADLRPQVETCADRVFSLNPHSAQGHWLKSWLAFGCGDLRAAIRAGEEAHALEPDNPDVLLLLGYLYAHAGRNEDARVLLDRALLLDPLTPLTQGVQGFVPVMEGRFDAAVGPYERALAMEPESPFFATFHGWALAYARRTDEAIATLRDVARRFPGTVFASYARSLSHGLAGEREEALQAIRPDFEAAGQCNEMFARELAHCYALAGQTDRAIHWLEHSIDQGMWNHAYLADHDWFLDGLRREQRFVALLERVQALSAW